jgi:acyl-coenzyme A thioesterase PaaI-like protein
MPATTDMRHSAYHRLRNDSHPDCVICGSSNGHGLGLDFHIVGNGIVGNGIVEASFACDKVFQGYPAVLHGGVISALLDGAMTNCLFAIGHAAMTVELNVRFRHPVATDKPATVRAWITSSTRPVHELAAELIQDGQTKATAKATFMEKTAISWLGKMG